MLGPRVRSVSHQVREIKILFVSVASSYPSASGCKKRQKVNHGGLAQIDYWLDGYLVLVNEWF